MTDAEIAALKAAAERAEPKVWRQGVDYDDGALIAPDSNDWLAYFSVSRDPPDADGARLDFVALANPATILALIARLEEAERERDEARRRELDADRYGEERHRETQARALAAEARAERLAAVLEAEREERRAERAVQEAEYAICWAEARDDDAAYERATQQHTAAIQAYCLAHQRAEAARAALAAGRGEAEGGEHGRE